MPSAPLHPCPCSPTCPVLLPPGVPRCRAGKVQQEHGRWNYTDRRRYRTHRWKVLREQVLREAEHRCAIDQRVHLHLEVDHIQKPTTEAMFWDRNNLQALCRTHHQEKTNRGE